MTFSSLSVWALPMLNLRPLLNTNIPLISGNCGLRYHFWPLESCFLMRKSEKKGLNSKSPYGRILISWNLILYTFLCTKIKKFTMGNFFSVDAFSSPMWTQFENRVIHFVEMKKICEEQEYKCMDAAPQPGCNRDVTGCSRGVKGCYRV